MNTQQIAQMSLQAVLSTPTPAPDDQRPRYSSTPWSERPTEPPTTSQASSSILPSIESSATPGQLVLRLPTSSQPTKRKYGAKILLESDKTKLLRICKRREGEYGRIPDSRFWKKVATEYAQLTGGEPHTTLSRTVNGWIKTRKLEKEEETGEQDPLTSYIQAIDEWIEVIDARQATKDREKEHQGQADRETETSLRWRENQFNTLRQKNQLGLEDDEDDKDDEDEGNLDTWEDTDLATTPSIAPSSTPSTAPSRSQPLSRKTPKRARREPPVDPVAAALVSYIELQRSREEAPAKPVGEIELKVASLKGDIADVKSDIGDIKGNIAELLLILKGRA